jgi:hypothetical protein
MKPFNLEEAKAGKPIQYRNGRKVTFIAHVPTAWVGSRVVCLGPGGEIILRPESGIYNTLSEQKGNYFIDLVMAPEKKTVWINLYKANVSLYTYDTGYWYNTQEEADRKQSVENPRIGGKAYPVEVEL